MKLILSEPCCINGIKLPAGEVIEWPDQDFPLPYIIEAIVEDAETYLLPEEDQNNPGQLLEVHEAIVLE